MELKRLDINVTDSIFQCIVSDKMKRTFDLVSSQGWTGSDLTNMKPFGLVHSATNGSNRL